MRPGVHELDPQAVALGGADHRAGRGPVVHPPREEHSRRDLELDVSCGELVLGNASRAVRTRRRGIEKGVEVVRAADGRHLGADHCGVTHRRVVVRRQRPSLVRVDVVVPARHGVALERELAHEGNGRQRSCGGQELASCEPRFSHG